MRWAIPASVGIHLGLIAAAWMVLSWQPEDMSAAEAALSIEVVATEEAVTEPSETVSEATANLVSAGADVAVPETVEAEVAEPVAMAEPVEAAEDRPAEPVAAVAAVPVAQIVASAPTEALVSAALLTAVTEVTAPVPKPRLVREAVGTGEQPEDKPVEKKPKAAEKPVEKPQKKPPGKVANLGNGGDADADSAASKAGGKPAKASSGGGDVDSYKGKVQSKLRRSLRYPKGARGDGVVMVQFVISGSGSASGIRVTGSSGNGDLDDAAIATVKRAAPFPPIPPELGQSNVTIVMPLQFNG